MTTTLPRIPMLTAAPEGPGCSWQRYRYVPTVPKLNADDVFAGASGVPEPSGGDVSKARAGGVEQELRLPSGQWVAVCPVAPAFVQRTESPTSTVTEAQLPASSYPQAEPPNQKSPMFTVTVAPVQAGPL